MKKFNIIILLVISATISFAGTITKTYNLSSPKIVYYDEYQSVVFDDALLTGITGEPALPYFAVSLLVPPGEVATSIKFIGENEVTVEGNFKLMPYQSSKPLSDPYESDFQIDEGVYKSNNNYPLSSMGGLSTNYLNGHSIAMSTFSPVVYLPAQGKLSYYSRVTIVIETSADSKSVDALNNLSSSISVKRNILNIIQNPESLSSYDSFQKRSEDNYNLLIITPDQFVDDFDGLRSVYLSRGVKSEIFTKEFISSNISGQDLQEKIRNFIIQEYQESNIEYVLLGGDIEHIPYRGFFCYVESGGGYSSSNIPADLYYSALDGTWNDDGDNNWGEPEEDDLLPDVAVARYPFSNSSELAKIIHKTINYQNNPVLGELETPLLAGEHLYGSSGSWDETWGRDYLDLLIGERDDNGYTTNGIPETYQIDSLYEHDGSWYGSDLMNEINAGKQFVHHVGHASPSYVAHLSTSDITNSNFSGANGVDHNYTLMQTHGCDCGSFDYNDCILEKMVTIDNFAVAVVGNSRYGWFNEGQTEGPAAHLHREMVDAMYHEKMNHLGSAFAESKIQTAPWVEAPGQWEEGALRWNFYDINILGDPVLSVWTNEPIDIDVDYSDAIMIGSPSTMVNITSDGLPMENFTCTIMKDGLLYATGDTDSDGNVTLIFDPVVIEVGEASLIVVGYNCLPDTSGIGFIPSEGAHVIYNAHEIIDTEGNNNGMPDFGESIGLTVAINNLGVELASGVVATLSVSDDYVSIIDGNEIFGDVAAGDTVITVEAFSFDIVTNVPDQHVVVFNLVCESNGDAWDSNFEIIINAPLPVIGDMVIDDNVGGNGNGQLDPGETAIIKVTATNSGHSNCGSSQMGLISSSPYLAISPGTVDLESMNVGESKIAEFNVDVDAATPIGTLVDFECELNICEYTDQKTYYNNVGMLIEDFETGDFTSFEWLDQGNAAWSITNNNPFAGEYCVQSGDIGDNASSGLYVTLIVADDDVVSFARKVSSEAGWAYLTFSIDNNEVEQWSGEESWEVVTYEIDAGQHTLLWSYEKDMNTIGGSDCGWIDDIIFPATTEVISVEEFVSGNEFSIFPNPGTGHYTVKVNSIDEVTNIVVYNTLGSVVSAPKADFKSGQTNIDLSKLIPGIYFVEVITGSNRMIKKIVQR